MIWCLPDIAPATLYRYYAAIRGYLEIKYEGKHLRHIAAEAMHKAAQVTENPSDMINAAVETLLAEPAELPAFGTLDRLAGRIRRFVNGGIYRTVAASLFESEQQALLRLLEQDGTSPFTLFDRIKEAPKSATITHLDDWLSRLIWLQSLGNMEQHVQGVRSAKIIHLAQEARSLYPSDLLDFTLPKRLTLLVCLLHHATILTRDEVVQMFLRRMATLTAKAKQELERIRASEREITERLVEVLAEVVQTSSEAQNPAESGIQVRKVLDQAGGPEKVLEQCEQVSAHHGDRYQPFMKHFYRSHRKALFRVIKTLDLRFTTSDQDLINAMQFIITHEHSPQQYLEATFELSFASQKWQRTVLVRRKGKWWFRRHHLETCCALPSRFAGLTHRPARGKP